MVTFSGLVFLFFALLDSASRASWLASNNSIYKLCNPSPCTVLKTCFSFILVVLISGHCGSLRPALVHHHCWSWWGRFWGHGWTGKYLMQMLSCSRANLFQVFTLKEIQWGSEIWTSLDFEWSKRGWDANVHFEWVLKSRSLTIWIRTNAHHFVQKPFEIWTKTSKFWMVCFSNGWDYSYGHSQTI